MERIAGTKIGYFYTKKESKKKQEQASLHGLEPSLDVLPMGILK